MDSTYRKHKEIKRLYEPTQSKFPERPCTKAELEYLLKASQEPSMITKKDKDGTLKLVKAGGLDGKNVCEIYADVMERFGAVDSSTTRTDLIQEGFIFMTCMVNSFSKPDKPFHLGPRALGAKTKSLEHFFKHYYAYRCRTVAINATGKAKNNSVDESGEEFDGEDLFVNKRDDDTPHFLGMNNKEMEVVISKLRDRLSRKLSAYRQSDGSRVKSKLECFFDDLMIHEMPARKMQEKYKSADLWHPKDSYRNAKFPNLKAQLEYEIAVFKRKHEEEKQKNLDGEEL